MVDGGCGFEPRPDAQRKAPFLTGQGAFFIAADDAPPLGRTVGRLPKP